MTAIRPQSRKFKRHVPAITMLIPFLVVFLAFVVWPLFSSLYISFTDYRGIVAPSFTGLDNYADLLSDPRFWKALFNTVVFVVATVIAIVVVSYVLALAFHGQSMRDKIVRTLLFLPSVTSTIALILVWHLVFSPLPGGLANVIASWFGAPVQQWLAQPELSMPIMVFVAVFGALGYNTILLSSGINNVSPDLEEAAAIDGAGYWRRVFNVVIPQTLPVIVFVVVTTTIASFQVFDIPYLLYSGIDQTIGVQDSGLTIVTYLYQVGFDRLRLGSASAMSWVLFIIIFVVGLIQLRLTRSTKDL